MKVVLQSRWFGKIKNRVVSWNSTIGRWGGNRIWVHLDEMNDRNAVKRNQAMSQGFIRENHLRIVESSTSSDLGTVLGVLDEDLNEMNTELKA